MEKPALWTQEFLGMSLSSFFQYMVHYALIAALPMFVIDTLQGNERQAGLAMTFFQLGAVACRPFAGKWIDQFDKGRLLFISLGLFVLVCVLYVGANSLYFLYAIRLLHGLVFAVASTTAAATAAVLLPVTRRGEGIGYFAVFSNLAMVTGPVCSLLLLAYFPFRAVFIGCLAAGLLAFWCGNRRKLTANVRTPAVATGRSWHWSSFMEVKAAPMAVTGGLLFFAYTGVLVFMPLYTKMLRLTADTSLFFVVFATVIVITRPLVGRLFDRAGADRVVYPGFALFVIGLLVLSQIQGVGGLLGAAAIIGAGFGALTPAFQTLAIQNSPGQRAGVATATYFFALDISVGLGSFFLSAAVAHLGYRAMYLLTAGIVAGTAAWYHLIRRQGGRVSGL